MALIEYCGHLDERDGCLAKELSFEELEEKKACENCKLYEPVWE